MLEKITKEKLCTPEGRRKDKFRVVKKQKNLHINHRQKRYRIFKLNTIKYFLKLNILV